jgi:hypothetical protein
VGLTNLAEAVILQSLGDICTPAYRKESKEFFEGDGFKIFAEIAGLNVAKRFRILLLLGGKQWKHS